MLTVNDQRRTETPVHIHKRWCSHVGDGTLLTGTFCNESTSIQNHMHQHTKTLSHMILTLHAVHDTLMPKAVTSASCPSNFVVGARLPMSHNQMPPSPELVSISPSLRKRHCEMKPACPVRRCSQRTYASQTLQHQSLHYQEF